MSSIQVVRSQKERFFVIVNGCAKDDDNEDVGLAIDCCRDRISLKVDGKKNIMDSIIV